MAVTVSTQSENLLSAVPAADLNRRIELAAKSIRGQLLAQRDPDGYWVGELSGSALSTATAISALSFYQQSHLENPDATRLRAQVDAGIGWLSEHQNQDGGWGDTDLSYSNISTTMLVVAAFHAAGRAEQFSDSLHRAQKYIDSQGGVPALRRRYGKDKTFAVPILANCAMAGIVPWREVGAFPFEAACVPQRFYHLMRMPVVSYAVPALVAIGQAKFVNDPPRNPLTRMIRKLSVKRSLRVLDRMQPASGGFLEAIPLTSFVVMALIKSGRGDHNVVQNGVRFILESFRDEGTWPIDTNLATWNSTLSINALSQYPNGLHVAAATASSESATDSWSVTLDWLLDCQYKTVHPFTGSPPGGWGWSDLSGSVPDADDTPGALLALANLNKQVEFDDSRKKKIIEAAGEGVRWLLDLQNRDRGWPTFCRGWGRFPFDRSGADITAHVLRALIAWKSQVEGRLAEPKFQSRIERAIEKGFRFLDDHQRPDGSWLPLWFGNQDYQEDDNPCYGTAKVLLAYRDANRFDTQAAEKGLNWIAANQNDDGGWGGGKSLTRAQTPSSTGAVEELGTSSVEESALCLETLVYSTVPAHREIVFNGVRWLVSAVENDLAGQCWPIGFYFAKLWYYEKLYPLIFATSSLGAVMTMVSTEPDEVNDNINVPAGTT